jgi:hypothetical protein
MRHINNKYIFQLLKHYERRKLDEKNYRISKQVHTTITSFRTYILEMLISKRI